MGRLVLGVLVLAGCSLRGGLTIDRVDPSSGANTVEIPVQIEGTNFHLPITSSVDDGTTVVGDMIVTLGDIPLPGTVWRDTELIEATVPAGLPTGIYPVTVQLGDRSDVLVDAYTVTDSRVVPPAGPCGKPSVLADDFQDGAPAPVWTVSAASGVVEQAGTLVLTPTGAETGYRSDPFVDMTDAAAEIEVRGVATAGSGVLSVFQFSTGSTTFGISEVDDTLRLGLAGAALEIPFDAVAHRHWRIEEASGTLMFATSPDGIAWTVQHTAPTPASARFVSVGLLALNPAASPTPGTVTFAEFSSFVAPSAWCPTTDLSDAFDDSVIGREWAYHGHTSNGCTETESGTAAHVDQLGTTACDAFFASSSLYTLEGSQIVARITAITNFTTGWFTYLGVSDLGGASARLYFEQNTMCADGTGITKTCVPYVTSEDLWRIREDAGTMFFETANSADGIFRVVYSGAAPFSLAAVRARFGTLTDRAINQSIGLSVDSFN